MNRFDVLAMMPSQPAPGQEANPTAQLLQMLGMFAILGVMFYFLLIRPQQKQRKEQESMLKNMKTGDRVLTSGGIYGIITNVKDKSVLVKIADNVKVEVAKTAISGVVRAADDGGVTESK
jgi:preprotein translocase subunit YajC